ncbi:TonB family protein [Arcobacter sp. YIC-80]|uniref:TonB family protein n=1 Tax=Arcobacter sp. YIC-80 TaxID=3376683 RepID=UPI00384CA8E6
MNLQLLIISFLSISAIHYYLFSMEIPQNKTIPIKQEIIKEHKVKLQMAQIQKVMPKPETIIEKTIQKQIIKKEAIKKIPIKKKTIKKKSKIKKVKKKIQKPIEKIVKKEPIKQTNKIVNPQKQVNKQKIKEEQNKLKTQYLYALRAKINENKHYPRISKRLKEQGISTISFRVLKNGNFINIKISKSSKKKRLDKAALDAIISTNSFIPFYKKINVAYMDITIPIEFKIQ